MIVRNLFTAVILLFTAHFANADFGVICDGMTAKSCAKEVRKTYFRGISHESYSYESCGEAYPRFLPSIRVGCSTRGSDDPCSIARENAHAEALAACQVKYGNRCRLCNEYQKESNQAYAGRVCSVAADYSPNCSK